MKPLRIFAIRTCIACRKSENSANLLRVVLVDGAVTPDLKGNLPGRGARLHRACGFDAIHRKAFKWAFKLTESPDVSQFKKFLTELSEMDAKDMKLK